MDNYVKVYVADQHPTIVPRANTAMLNYLIYGCAVVVVVDDDNAVLLLFVMAVVVLLLLLMVVMMVFM